ncbi:LacI family transcriptional regulator [Cryobacterium roopkundense]|uniref:DNA-binding LacI/PurR family transcriptional regulator n=1 Tax=Cryobacterium roopkundense TaxID=1001240 RepID=A0A099J0S2_9MICO|nr:LacI family DNA-binding transcriptional regulator [Cryobacterium roopkundense]KGJ71866.1 LacI family transcriptional regulator [Cryobacterium roopkundense]MBB5640828.1 DNA-binding LacI/PurR family transcriptional regulator [Cryobacterium roopkundense]
MADFTSKRATIRDVAVQAGVSKSVVSLVLRGTGYVSDAKRIAVAAAVRELDYRPNAAARTLTEARSYTVGVVLHDLRNPWFVEAVDGLNAVLNAHGLQMLLGDHRLDSRGGSSLLGKLLEMNVDGLVLVGTLPPSEDLINAVRQVPTVVLGAPEAPAPSADVVTDDNEAGAHLAVQHLVSLGHRRIAHLGAGPTPVGLARRAGYEQAMTESGLAELMLTVDGGLTEQGGYEAGLQLLDPATGIRPTAIFAVNDMAAFGLLSAADELGCAVPDDLSIVGYDNTPTARMRHISLTSIDNASLASGRKAGELLVARLADPVRPASLTLLAPSLAVRGSSAPPRA